ncbi:MAG: hypothetical protein JST21_01910 [Bacteroidetes bacterium]|nr:hypothetical protein [Bacteroidota bacterium]
MFTVLAIAITAFRLTTSTKQSASTPQQDHGQASCDRKFQDEAKQNLMLRKFISYTNTSRLTLK